jgi:uncharacterized tellurite resistance protein B-like protein
MFNALRDFVRQIGSKPEAQHYSDDDKRLALAALLVHCTAIDGVVDDVERDKLRVLLADEFGLAGAELETLVSEAIAADNEAVDLYRFTSVLTRNLTAEDRVHVVEKLWEIVFADGKVHEFEENLVWRVAELLGVARYDRLAMKFTVAKRQGVNETED